MKHCNVILSLIACLLSIAATAQNTSELDKTVLDLSRDNAMRHATLSVCVYNMTQHRNVYAYNSQRSMIPASMNKIFTTAIAMEKLGMDFRFKTTLAYSGTIDNDGVLNGNIYIIGGGDPLLGSYRYKQTNPDTLFNTWYRALVNQGIKRIKGRVCYNQSVFDNQFLHDSWQWGDIGNYYGAGTCGLNFHENMYFAYFNAGKRLGYPALLDHTEPRLLNIRNINEVSTGPENSGDNVVIYGDPNNIQRLYRGTVPLGKNNFSIRGSMANPAATCAELFATYLRHHGVNVSTNTSEVATIRDSCHTFIEYYSNTYYVIAQYINQTSNNTYAECVFKYLGLKWYGKGNFTNGSKVLMDYFKAHHLETSGIRIVDGCGLSRMNKMTSDFTCRFLYELSKTSYYKDFLKTMAVAGRSGTARKLLANVPLNGRLVYVKSGTMDGIKAFCGYVVSPKGDHLCYCIMSNDHECSNSVISKQLEQVLLKIAQLK
ncbi:MAG: D-alanyl-D-alanine carboxypeptidase/D-alanyl-D-alanine-endopeptidase [Bacteroidales bacterium]|nr:D-alanyl-D-alanine carboxypeptidase/D-alanyl-D-alanine-endopeptidase [Candidatus Colimorpha onthohippi]